MIRIANLLSADLNGVAHGLGSLLQSSVGQSVEVDGSAGVEDFRAGRIGIALVCGLVYSRLHDGDPDRFAAVAAPVVDDPRGGGDAVYFSDIVVPTDSAARTLRDLSGTRFACNEPVSFSGCRALEYELISRGWGWDLFSERVHTGSHAASLAALARGDAEAAAIDSHVLMLARRRDPGLGGRLRVLESLGPYPAPPIAINTGSCDVSPERLAELLDRLPPEPLGLAGIRGWRRMDDAGYDPIRAVTRGLPGLDMLS